jgi:hypothetical protein
MRARRSEVDGDKNVKAGMQDGMYSAVAELLVEEF